MLVCRANQTRILVLQKRVRFRVALDSCKEHSPLVIAPSPVRDVAKVQFSLAQRGTVAIELFDVSGRRVGEVARAPFEAGRHAVSFRRDTLAPGVYFLRLDAAGRVESRKFVVAAR